MQVAIKYIDSEASKTTQLLSASQMDSVNYAQILEKVVCISHSTNAVGKGINKTIFSLSYV